MAIKTIFFDIGGVLLTNGWDRNQRTHALKSLGMTDLSGYEARHADANYFWERGLKDIRWFFQKTVFYDWRRFEFEDLWAAMVAEQGLLENGAVEILKKLHATRKYRLATLTNESKELNTYRMTAFGLKDYFDFFICSAYVNEMKPAPKIYLEAIEVSGREPAECVFIDDKQENVDAAIRQEMRGILYRNPEQLEEDLRDLGVVW